MVHTDTMAEMAAMAAAISLAPGGSLGEDGRYRLEHLLGTGGMASVWLARDARLDREVAVKVLADVLALDDDYVLRFEREARVAAQLSHPHLVKVFDFTVAGPRPYLVMEYVAGGTLADRLRRPGDRTWNVEVLARELLDALGYIHSAGVIHRDIKPANVLIGTDGRARLTDFGIAHPDGATRLTSTGMVVGSARFMAPEVMGGEPATERSDLYSLGVLIQQCLTGETTPQLDALVSGLTAVRPEQRPASAGRAIEILDGGHPTELDGGHPTEPTWVLPSATGPTQVRYRATRPTLRRIARSGRKLRTYLDASAVAVIAAFAVLLIAVIALATSGGGSGSPASALGRASPNAPLSTQLNQLDQAINQSRR